MDIETFTEQHARVFCPARTDLIAVLSRATTARPEDIARALEIKPRDALAATLSLVVDQGKSWPGMTSASEAWEMLAPAEWLGDELREFDGGQRVPPSVRAVICLLSDVQGVVAAEALVREFASRLAERLQRPSMPTCVQWRFAEPRTFRSAALAPKGDVCMAAEAVLRSAGRDLGALTRSPVHEPALQALMLQLVARLGPSVHDVTTLLRMHTAISDERSESILSPLVSLWLSGYALDRVTEHALVMVCPWV